MLNRNIEHKAVIKDLYYDIENTISTTDKIIKEVVLSDSDRFGYPVQVKKYPLSVEETIGFVVINLIIQDLHKMSFVNKILDDSNEKRHILIYTTKSKKISY